MKSKKLLLSASAIILTVAALIFATAYFDLTSEVDKEQGVIDKPQAKRGIAGAMQYYWERRKNVKTGKIELSDLLQAERAVAAFAEKQSKSSVASLNLLWVERGPDNVGGRTRAILFDKDDPKKMYAGAVSGGMWRSTNGGVAWVKATTQLAPQDNLAVSCITQAANGYIYFGTGESFAADLGCGSGCNGAPGAIGKGVWKSTDGINFNRLSSTVPTDTNSSSIAWAFVNRLAADPVNANRIYAATNKGLLISDNGGDTWTNPLCLNPPTCSIFNTGNAVDVKVASDGTVIASVGNATYLSTDGGNTFVNLATAGIFNPSGVGRLEFAIAPSNPNYIYCSASNTGGTLLNIYQSKDKGQSWDIIIDGGGSIEIFNGQGWYDNAIAVYPDNPEHIIVGGVSLFEWSKTGGWAETDIFQVHADKHTFAFHPDYDGVTNRTLFAGTDGGIYKSDYAGLPFSYTEANRNYITTQFYAVGFSRDGAVAGGTQDNGNPYIDGTGNTPKAEVYNLPSGDGGYVQISTINPDAFFWESQSGAENRSPNRALDAFGGGDNSFFPDAGGGAWVTPFLLWESFNDTNSTDSVQFTANKIDLTTGDTIEYTYPADTTIAMQSKNNKYPFNYVTPVQINPGDTLMIQDIVQSKFFVGITSGIWLAKDVLDFSKPPEWYKLNTSGGAVCMGYSSDGDVLFVGISTGIRRISGILSIKPGDPSTDNLPANIPSGITSTSITIPGGQIVTGIAVDPNNANNVVVTLGNYGSTNHVYRSTNALGAATFTSIQSGLPPMPVYDAVIDKADSNRIIIATEYGVYGTNNGFTTIPGDVIWTEENTGMARVPTYMIDQQKLNNNICTGVENSGVIYIGTHGRGIFSCNTFADPAAPTVSVCDVGSGVEENTWSFNPNMKIYPNPLFNGKGNVSFILDRSLAVTIKIFDLSGRVIETIDMGKQAAGAHKVTFDSSRFSAGTYFVSLTAGEFRQAAKFVVVN